MHIYNALFMRDEPIDIRRSPISLYCERDHRWFTFNGRGTFSNFTYCLKTWQVQAITNLTIEIPGKQGMTEYLAEWNDIFSLVAASFSSLETISIQVQLYDPISACWNPFWDGGLLELDRLQLKDVKFIIIDGDLQPYFTYSANPSQHQSLPFHQCRDRLRSDREYNHDDNEYLCVFFRKPPNPCPLYASNLIRPLSWYEGTDRMIRHENMLQRDHPSYQYNFENSGTVRRAIIGYQFDAAATSKVEIEENTKKLHQSRERLARKLSSSSQAVQSRPRRSQPHRTYTDSKTRRETVQSNSTRINDETPGQWRRLLNEETFAPFFESFPPPFNVTRSGYGPGRNKLACTGCSESVEAPGCFLHN